MYAPRIVGDPARARSAYVRCPCGYVQRVRSMDAPDIAQAHRDQHAQAEQERSQASE